MFRTRQIVQVVVVAVIGLTASSAAAEYPSLDDPPEMEGNYEKDAAVIVGIEDYAFLPNVAGAMQTVNDWETFLLEGAGIPSEQVYTLTNADATRERMVAYAKRARESVKPGGRLWFIYVGHGAPSPDGDHRLLVGVDAQSDPDNMNANGLERSRLVSLLEQGAQERTLVVIDACFSGKARTGQTALADGLQPARLGREPNRDPGALPGDGRHRSSRSEPGRGCRRSSSRGGGNWDRI